MFTIRFCCYIHRFFFNDTETTRSYTYSHTLSLPDALPILPLPPPAAHAPGRVLAPADARVRAHRRRPGLPGLRARSGWPRRGAVDAGRRAPVDRRVAARGRNRQRAADPGARPVPVTAPEAKSLDAVAAWDDDGLCQRAIRALKQRFPALGVITDVAPDPYTSHGQAGIVDDNAYVINDVTVEDLVQQAMSHASRGYAAVSVHDMMDEVIGAARAPTVQEG